MRLFRLFLFVFVMQSTAYAADRYTITYKCDVDNVTIFTQSYRSVDDPCMGTKVAYYIEFGKNFSVPMCLTTAPIKKGNSCLPSDWDYDAQTQCVTSWPYAPKMLADCDKIGYDQIGWYDNNNKIMIYFTGYSNDPVLEQTCSDCEKISYSSNYKWESNLTLYPVWKSTNKTCKAGQYLSGENNDCETCLPGYYCLGVANVEYDGENYGLNPCPTGSTSDAGAAAETSCYVKPFVSRFTSGSGITFSLPAGAKEVYYNGK